MKSFTVTFHHTCNYGAVLQTYALQKTINALGVQNEIMEYPDNDSLYEKIDITKPVFSLKMLYINAHTFFRKKQIMTLKKRFFDFHKNHLNLSKRYLSIDELRNDPPSVDFLITGSDQVWNMNINRDFIPARFLDFGDKATKRLSYAASIERMNYSPQDVEYVRKTLKAFDGISLREESAKQYIEEITGYKCQTVLDPVFLLSAEEWLKIAVEPRIRGGYILCYQVRDNPQMQKVLDELKRRTGLKTVSINASSVALAKTDYSLFDVSPEEFIGMVANATFVVSASFHGAVFGLLFKKTTYCLVKGSTKNRMYDLFSSFGLEDFVIDEMTDISLLPETPKEYYSILEEKRNESLLFLREQFNV